MRQHHGTKWRGIEIDRLVAASLEPRKQVGVGRRQSRPDQLDLVRVFAAEIGRSGLRQPRRDTDPHRTGHELQQRPASGFVELVQPARKLPRQLGLPERAQRGDDLAESRRWWVVVQFVVDAWVITDVSPAVPPSLTLPRKGGGNGENRAFITSPVAPLSRGIRGDRILSLLQTPLRALPPCGGGLGRGVAPERL